MKGTGMQTIHTKAGFKVLRESLWGSTSPTSRRPRAST